MNKEPGVITYDEALRARAFEMLLHAHDYIWLDNVNYSLVERREACQVLWEATIWIRWEIRV